MNFEPQELTDATILYFVKKNVGCAYGIGLLIANQTRQYTGLSKEQIEMCVSHGLAEWGKHGSYFWLYLYNPNKPPPENIRCGPVRNANMLFGVDIETVWSKFYGANELEYRQAAILRAMISGYGVEDTEMALQIAAEKGIAPSNAATYARAVLRNRAEMAQEALRRAAAGEP